ncbi:hypothetical protein L208DRAFT_1378231 [Tricholoma matsutake]|nr:hypothetical protein L208DRAFT_1378231 [Tricholoma matsutake 945]
MSNVLLLQHPVAIAAHTDNLHHFGSNLGHVFRIEAKTKPNQQTSNILILNAGDCAVGVAELSISSKFQVMFVVCCMVSTVLKLFSLSGMSFLKKLLLWYLWTTFTDGVDALFVVKLNSTLLAGRVSTMVKQSLSEPRVPWSRLFGSAQYTSMQNYQLVNGDWCSMLSVTQSYLGWESPYYTKAGVNLIIRMHGSVAHHGLLWQIV